MNGNFRDVLTDRSKINSLIEKVCENIQFTAAAVEEQSTVVGEMSSSMRPT